MKVRCPTKRCPNHERKSPEWIIRKGFFQTKSGKRVQKYQCGCCGKYFSDQTGTLTYREHKPEATKEVFKWYCSAATQRRLARNVEVNRKTVVRKFERLSKWARKTHNEKLRSGSLVTNYIFFDEMQHHIHSRLKPVTIALAVRAKTGEILEVSVSSLPSRRKPGRQKQLYPNWINNGWAARERTMLSLHHCRKENTVVGTDQCKIYPSLVHAHGFEHRALKRRKVWEKRDPMFWLNHVCARIRADLSRMRRRTWVTSKSIKHLQMHLDLYIAYQNGYTFG